MGDRAPEGITEILHDWASGAPEALRELMPQVVAELRQLAQGHLQREARGHTLQPTALVNEVYLRFVDQRHVQFENRSQFFAFASRLMRRILVDYFRARQADKRGSDRPLMSLDEALEVPQHQTVDLLVLNDALEQLKALDPRQSEVVEMRYFGGLTIPETAEALGISPATVKREWLTAKAWLQHTLAT